MKTPAQYAAAVHASRFIDELDHCRVWDRTQALRADTGSSVENCFVQAISELFQTGDAELWVPARLEELVFTCEACGLVQPRLNPGRPRRCPQAP